MHPAIELENLTKIFGKHEQDSLELLLKGQSNDDIYAKTGDIVAVREVSFTIVRGQISTIMGLSGSGKSTLLRCINRLVEPTSGKVYIGLESQERLEMNTLNNKNLLDVRRNNIAMVFQNFGLFDEKSILSNVCFGLSLQRKNNQRS